MKIRLRMFGVVAIAATTVFFSLATARSEALSAGGFLFSDELGGFRLVSVSGDGTITKPFMIVEEIFDTQPAVLVIKRELGPKTQPGWKPAARRSHIFVAKTIRNLTKKVWSGFELELRQWLTKPSTFYDGLSFDQMLMRDEDFASDRFTRLQRIYEPVDRVRFDGGHVDPDEQLKLKVPITDPTPVGVFYLVQQPTFLVAGNQTQLPAYPNSGYQLFASTNSAPLPLELLTSRPSQ